MSLRVHMSSPFVSPAPYPSRLVNVNDSFDSRRFDRSPPPNAPPITTLAQPDHSPSPSVVSQDRSSNSTPHIRRSPPMPPPPNVYYHQHDAQMIPSSAPRQSAHFSSRPEAINPHPYPLYAPQHPFDQHRYDHHQDRHQYPVPSGMPGHSFMQVSQSMHEPYGRQQYPSNGGPPPVTIVHTDDASTKLTDGIRRRCFNCCTTDTSTWRRSNLSPGKVLCNKCGLFERTHSRPRPDQFPHKRGPLATSTLRGRTPPGLAVHSSSSSSGAHAHAHHSVHNGSTQLPPISAGGPSGHPYQYHHANLTPLNAPGGDQYTGGPSQGQNPLPGLGSWHNTSSSSSGGASNGQAQQQQQQQQDAGPNGNGNGTGNNSASNSAHGTPQIQSRRSTIDASPRMQPSSSSSASVQQQQQQGQSSTASNTRRYDDGLSSNAAAGVVPKEEGASPPGSRSGGNGNGNGNGGSSGQQQQLKAEAASPEA